MVLLLGVVLLAGPIHPPPQPCPTCSHPASIPPARPPQALAADPTIYERLSASIAPSIWQLEDVKKGVLCQLFGGVSKVGVAGFRWCGWVSWAPRHDVIGARTARPLQPVAHHTPPGPTLLRTGASGRQDARRDQRAAGGRPRCLQVAAAQVRGGGRTRAGHWTARLMGWSSCRWQAASVLTPSRSPFLLMTAQLRAQAGSPRHLHQRQGLVSGWPHRIRHQGVQPWLACLVLLSLNGHAAM